MSHVAQAKRRTATIYRLVIPTKTLLILILGVMVLLVEIGHLAFLTAYPPVFIDEIWNANAAWNWLQTGINFDSIHTGALDQAGYEWLRWPTLGNAPWLASFALFGLGFFQLRLVSWVAGICLLVATFVVGRRNYGSITGVTAALLLALSQPFLQASHYARWDIMIAALVMAAYALALVALEEDRWAAHLIGALLIGLSLDIHLNGILFAPALATLYLVFYQKKVLSRAGTWLAALGGLLGILFFVAIKIVPNPDAYFAQFNFSYAFTHKLPISELNPLDLLASLRAEIGRYHFFENSLDFTLIGASLAYLLVRRSKADRLLLIFTGVAFLNFVLFVGNKHDVYAILLYPFFMLMVAETMVSLVREAEMDSKQRIFAGVLLGLALFSSIVHVARPFASHRSYDYTAITEQIRSYLPPGTRVMGRPEWWLGLADYEYRSNLNLTYYHYQNGYTMAEAFAAVRPDFLIVDTKWRQQLVDENAYPIEPGFGVYNLPREDFDSFLTQHGQELSSFYDPVHGLFEIWAIRWD